MKTPAANRLPTRPIIGIGIVGVFSKGLQAAAGILVAYTFGANHATDAYVAAKSLIIGIYLVADSPIYHALVPLWSKRDFNTSANQRFLGVALLAMILSAMILAGVLLLFAPPILRGILPGGGPETLAEAISLCRWMAVAVLVALPVSLLKAFNASRRRYLCAALDGLMMHIVLIAALLLAPVSWGLRPAAIAIPIAFIALAAIQLFAARRDFHPKFTGDSAGALQELAKLLIPILGINLLLQGNMFFLNAMASYTGESAISCMLYSYTMAQAPVSLIDLILFSALFPFASRLSSDSAFDAFRSAFYAVLKGLFLILLPLSLWMALSREDLIAFVLQHGRFDSANTQLTARCFLGHSLAILPWAVEAFAYRCLFALKRPGRYLQIVAVRVVCTVLGCFLFVPSLGLFGVVLAFASGLVVSAILSCIAVEHILNIQTFPAPPLSRLVKHGTHRLVRISLITILLVMAGFTTDAFRTEYALANLFLRLAVTAVPCVILSLGMYFVWTFSRTRTS